MLLDQEFPFVLDWGDGGSILFAKYTGGFFRVPENGGDAELVDEREALSGQFLPGGKLLLGVRAVGAVYLDTDADTSWVVVPGALSPRYVPETGHLLWVDEAGALWGAPFDPKAGGLSGERGIVLEGVSLGVLKSFAQYAVSSQGTLLYTSEGGYVGSVQTLTTVGLDGSVDVESLEPRFFESPRWSPDGRFVAYGGTEAGATSGDPQIYSYDMVAKSRPRRLTSVGTNRYPVWSPDGKTLVFTSQREGTDVGDLFLKTVADDSPPRLLLSMPGFQFASEWISEREILIGGGASGLQVWLVELPAEGSGDSVTARPYFESQNQQDRAYLAAQGDLITYSSDATGAWEVYTRSFPVPGSPEKITDGGGSGPHWSRDGNTIYYLSPRGDSLWAAHIDRGPPFAVVDAVPVIPWSYGLRAFDLHPDGDRIITTGLVSQNQATGGGEDGAAAVPSRSFLVTNWFTELKARLRGGSGR